MLSVCIPVYNQDVRILVRTLRSQMQLLTEPCEIVLIDDASEESFKTINRPVCQTETYIELKENTGRSRIRNLFPDQAKYDYLLFLDCDARIVTDNFLRKYLDEIRRKPDVKVLCGGWKYGSKKPARSRRLRWKYGKKRESRSVEQRRWNSNKSFMSGNFLIRKDILARYPFDERISDYGHEDTLFGFTLKQNAITVDHIENSPQNGENEKNTDFLRKTEVSIGNLSKILVYVGFDETFTEDLNLLRFYKKVRKFALVLKGGFWLLQSPLYFILSKGYGPIWLFDLYKLGLFCQRTPLHVRKEIK